MRHPTHAAIDTQTWDTTHAPLDTLHTRQETHYTRGNRHRNTQRAEKGGETDSATDHCDHPVDGEGESDGGGSVDVDLRYGSGKAHAVDHVVEVVVHVGHALGCKSVSQSHPAQSQ